MAQLVRFLSQKYSKMSGAPRSLRYITTLCYLGITIGALALMLALIITRGFEKEISKKMKGINSDAIITSYGNQLDISSLRTHITKWLSPWIAGISPSNTRYVLCTHNNIHSGLFLKGIIPKDEAKTTTLEEKIQAPYRATLVNMLSKKRHVIIGKTMAQQQNIKIGDSITLFVPHPQNKKKVALEKQTVLIAGIFDIGLEEYDANIAYCSRETFTTFFEDSTGADHIAVTFKKQEAVFTEPWYMHIGAMLHMWFQSNEEYTTRQLRKLKLLLSSLSVRGWQELYPEIVSSLALEKYAMTFVLALIALVASMMMVCLLFMMIQYKKKDIAILRAMGASQKDIYRIFLYVGMRLTIYGVMIGLGIAGLIGWWIQTYRPIQLPDVYYISYLPASLEPGNFIAIFVITILLSYVAIRIPLQQLKHISISDILRQ